jgi:large subunit ribosomal protein L3
VVSLVRTEKRDGYRAIQIGYGDMKESKVNKPQAGHFKKAGVAPKRFLAEVRLEDDEQYKTGDTITVDVFDVGVHVHVTGTSKGKGFQGVMKRHNFKGGPGGHGSHFHRAPGSIGMCASPSRVLKGVGMPGHMGSETVTVRNLEVVRTDAEQNLLILKGAVPGGKDGLLTIRLA